MRKLLVLSWLLAAVVGIVIFQNCNPSLAADNTTGLIRGYVLAEVPDAAAKGTLRMFIPDVTIIVKDSAGANVDTTVTALNGSYYTRKLKKGRYQLCLSKNGFDLICYNATVANASNHPGPLNINYNRDRFVWGSVKLKDGAAGFFNQPVFGVGISTTVTASVDTSSRSERCNSYGYYLIPGIPLHAKGVIKAVCQQNAISAPLTGQQRVDLTFANSSPLINSIVGYNEAGRSILRAHAGHLIKLVAATADSGHYPLHYQWVPFGKFAGFVTKDTNVVSWQLPTAPGKYEMDLMVFDSLGGVAYKAYTITAGEGEVNFSGNVSDIGTSAPIPNATIRVNGVYAAKADVNGYFHCVVKENPQDRYILNVSKPGYALCSRVYTNDAVAKVYRLVKATTQFFNPQSAITVTEAEDRYTSFGNDKDQREAAMVKIPAGSIVDSAGKAITGTVSVSIRAVNLRNPNGQMPGDFSGVKGGKNVRLESFGAVDVQIRDSVNPEIKYNLASGIHAEVNLPILTSQSSKAAPGISFWDYNESTGVWETMGTATRAGKFYRGLTTHFSVLNADIDFTVGTYIVLYDNPSNSVFNYPHPLSIVLYAPQAGGGVVQTNHIVQDLQPGDIAMGMPVVNLPANTVITIQIISNGTVLNTLNPRTGPVIPNSVGLPPPSPAAPYDPTAVTVQLLPNLLVISQQLLDQFLTCESNVFSIPTQQFTQQAAQATDYYNLIGANSYTTTANPTPHTITFQEWKDKNGYAADGSGDVNSIFYNAGDLDFWRGMHHNTFNGVSSYYVSNYSSDNDAINNPTNFIATVCMEFSPIVPGAGNVPVTKFYVFTQTGLQNAANLDNDGAGANGGLKYVPGLCITCHGGSAQLDYSTYANAAALQTYFNTSTADIPNFLGFDAKSYWYSTATGFTRPSQEENLRKLNNDVLSTETTTAISQFITAAYNGNPGTPGQGYNDNVVVDQGGAGVTWNLTTADPTVYSIIPSQFYVDVVGTTCRTCHVARNDPFIWFDTKQKFVDNAGGIQSLVCPISGQFMPNSKVAFVNFWTSQAPFRPGQVQQFFNFSPPCPTTP